jgi:hypothetical protein
MTELHVSQAPLSEIAVQRFRTTLFWPLMFDPADADLDQPVADLINSVTGRLDKEPHWHRVQDLLNALPQSEEADALAHRLNGYSEFVYFHDFVQDVLFRGEHNKRCRHPLRLYRRDDITALRVCLVNDDEPTGGLTFHLKVDRLLLYVASTGSALLVTELSSPDEGPIAGLDGTRHGASLAEVLKFNDEIRRFAAPYYCPKESAVFPASCPVEVTWLTGATELPGSPYSAVLSPEDVVRKEGDTRQTNPVASIFEDVSPSGRRHVAPFPWWQALLPGSMRLGPAGVSRRSWRAVSDERMPLLASIDVTGPDKARPLDAYRAISRGGWTRLCFLDPPDRHEYLYAPQTLGAFETENCYDRFHYLLPEDRVDERESSTRYLLCGYAMTAVGAGEFFDLAHNVHMRRHYFQLMLLAQFEQLNLLLVSSRISRVVGAYEQAPRGEEAERALARRLELIETDLLLFVHRFRFTGVSNQLQPAELYAQLRARMGLDALYQDVKDEVTTTTTFLAARAAGNQASAQGRLSVIAALGVVAGLTATVLGMNVLFGSEDLKNWVDLKRWASATPGLPHHLFMVGAVGCVVGSVAQTLTYLLGRDGVGRDPSLAITRKGLWFWIGLSGSVLVVALAMLLGARTP